MPELNNVMNALNATLPNYKLQTVASLQDNQMTPSDAVCMSFAGELLEKVGGEGAPYSEQDDFGPREDEPDGVFFHFCIMGQPSELINHGFCVYFADSSAYVIQVFQGRSVNLLNQMTKSDFTGHLTNLRRNQNVIVAYRELFGVEIDQDFKVATIYTTKVG